MKKVFEDCTSIKKSSSFLLDASLMSVVEKACPIATAVYHPNRGERTGNRDLGTREFPSDLAYKINSETHTPGAKQAEV